jgi:phage terminase large subunit-like protein
MCQQRFGRGGVVVAWTLTMSLTAGAEAGFAVVASVNLRLEITLRRALRCAGLRSTMILRVFMDGRVLMHSSRLTILRDPVCGCLKIHP